MHQLLEQRTPYRYRGYRYDTETGLYYLNSRYYNPEWGRFLNADAIAAKTGDLLSANMFAYCKNNVVNMSDPDGYFGLDTLIGAAAGFVIGGTVAAITDYVTTGHFDRNDILTSALGGGITGALATCGMGVDGQAIANGIVSGLQYSADCALSHKSVDIGELACNVGVGMISGTLGGPGLRNEEGAAGKYVAKVAERKAIYEECGSRESQKYYWRAVNKCESVLNREAIKSIRPTAGISFGVATVTCGIHKLMAY